MRLGTHNPITAQRRPAFTLIEMLVVMGIIVLVLTMVIPLFRAITGSRSTEAAENQVSGLLGVARDRAIGLQEPTGVVFWLDATGRTVMAVAHFPDPSNPTVLDLIDDADITPLQKGTAAQFLRNYDALKPDRYISQPGLILFDGLGRLLPQSYRIMSNARMPGLPASLLNKNFDSQFGLIVYDAIAFEDQGHTTTDSISDSLRPYSDEKPEEDWLDKNSMPLVVNRYNGTLIRGQ